MSHRCRAALLATLVVSGSGSVVSAADRQVAWVVVANEAATERELNALAARGLRLATVTDGLPCAVAIMQTPATPVTGEAAYRVVADRDLAAALPDLAAGGFEPRGMLRRPGGRAHVVWERSATRADRVSAWRIVEFANPDALEVDLAAAAAEGFRAAALGRVAFRSWPGLSEKGLMIIGQRSNAPARRVRVVRGTTRNVNDLAREVAALTAEGWELDVAFTTSRDGSSTARRERAYFVFSRAATATAPSSPLRLERSSSWGMVGSGEPVAAANYWDDFLFVWRPVERRHIWASPIRLSAFEAACGGLSMKLAIDGQREQRSTIVGAVARAVQGTDGYELVIVLDERVGR